MELVKILKHKKIKIGEDVKHILKVEKIAYADVNDNYVIMEDIDNKPVKQLPNSLKELENEDYVYQTINTKLLNLIQDYESEDETLKQAEETYLDMFYEVTIMNDRIIGIRETDDKKIKEEFDYFSVPSLAAEINSILNNSESADHIFLDSSIVRRMISKPANVKKVDNNRIKTDEIKNLYAKLRKIIFGQDEELKHLLANVIKDLSLSYSSLDSKVVSTLKSNILLVGPTGTGKTFIVESIAKLLNNPYIIVDAKRYTSNGFSGENVESILVDLYHICGDDMDKVNHAIVFIDEFDKICEAKDGVSYVNTTDVQEILLKLLDGAEIIKSIPKDRGLNEENLVFDTSRMTFVLSGAFSKLFDAGKQINEENLEQYGMIHELVGRIGSRVILNNPSKENLKDSLLNGEYSYLQLFNKYLEILGVEYEISDDFIDEIVDKAYNMNLGYRGLEVAISNFLDDYLFDIFGGDIKKLEYKKHE